MIVLYNMLQLLFMFFFWPVAVALTLRSRKYRGRILRRLTRAGLVGLDRLPPGGRIWIHALSVGEVKSVAAFIPRLRREFPDHVLVLSLATAAGEKLARENLGWMVDAIIPFPLDFYPVVRLWIARVNPALFIQVETDFWPNFLYRLKKQGVAAVLVNGRISGASLRGYRYLRGRVARLFGAYGAVCVANVDDAAAFLDLGVPPDRIRVSGNLKYDAPAPVSGGGLARVLAAAHGEDRIFVAASTHRGEEEIVLEVCRRLRARSLPVFLLLAPRDPGRGRAVAALAADMGLSVSLRRDNDHSTAVMVLDTIGELAGIFSVADMAFIGGSLVPRRGHNPLEAAVCGVPVLFGPSMEDFADMARDLIAAGGGYEVGGIEGFFNQAREWLEDDARRLEAGAAAVAMVAANAGVGRRIVALVREIMTAGSVDGEA